MNTTLLILGVFLILLSVILITINSTNLSSPNEEKNDNDYKIEEDSYKVTSEDKEEVLQVNYIPEETIIKKDDTDLEDEMLSKDFNESRRFQEDYLNADKVNHSTVNITDKIISMYKDDGLEVNEIAKQLKKGIREIEIILKVNNVKD